MAMIMQPIETESKSDPLKLIYYTHLLLKTFLFFLISLQNAYRKCDCVKCENCDIIDSITSILTRKKLLFLQTHQNR